MSSTTSTLPWDLQAKVLHYCSIEAVNGQFTRFNRLGATLVWCRFCWTLRPPDTTHMFDIKRNSCRLCHSRHCGCGREMKTTMPI